MEEEDSVVVEVAAAVEDLEVAAVEDLAVAVEEDSVVEEAAVASDKIMVPLNMSSVSCAGRFAKSISPGSFPLWVTCTDFLPGHVMFQM